MKDLCQYGNRPEDEWEILPWIPDPRPPFKIWAKPEQIGMPKMEFVGGHPDEYCIFLKNLTETELAQITSLDGAPLDVKEERSDIE